MTVTKFHFNRDFDATEISVEERHAEELKAVRAAAYAEGEQAGAARATSESATAREALIHRDVSAVGAALNAFQQEESARNAAARAYAAELAFIIGEQFGKAAVSQFPYDDIRIMAEDCFAMCEGEPRLLIRAHYEAIDDLKREFEAMASQIGYAGRLVLLGDETLAPGECRIEWPDGGMERKLSTIAAEVRKKVDDFVAAERSRNAKPSSLSDAENAALQTPPIDDVAEADDIDWGLDAEPEHTPSEQGHI